jgi:hypothetical protein
MAKNDRRSLSAFVAVQLEGLVANEKKLSPPDTKTLTKAEKERLRRSELIDVSTLRPHQLDALHKLTTKKAS